MILSDELQQELGSEYGLKDDSLVITESVSSRKQEKEARKRQKLNAPREEVKEIVKKLSKKKQKRLEQIKKRKERDLKQGTYLETIKENALGEDKMELIISSRLLNQQLSLRQLLTRLLKKERAGIKLTPEEHAVLYKNRKEVSDIDLMEIEDSTSSINNSLKATEGPPSDEITAEPEHSASVKNFFQDVFLQPISPSIENSAIQENKKKRKKKRKAEEEPVVESTVAYASSEPEIQHQEEFQEEMAPDDPVEESITVPSTNLPSGGNRLLQPIKKCKKRKPLRAIRSIIEDGSKESFEIKDTVNSISAQEPKKNETKSLGATLLEKFKKLKEKAIEKLESSTVNSEANNSRNCDDLNSVDYPSQSDGPKKVFEEIKIPIDIFGRVETSIHSSNALEATTNTTQASKRSQYNIHRPSEITSARINLPVCQMEQEIMEAVHHQDVIILCGETGSGKSTQLPQFLYEYGYAAHGLIGIAQPRRVAVISTADRVNYEMGQQKYPEDQRLVGYQVRYDSHTIHDQTKIKFMTDGILLREITQDVLLRKYSVIVLDEAHERNVNTDILLGMLSRAMPMRKQLAEREQQKYEESLTTTSFDTPTPPLLQPLKLIIMSATIRVKDFQSPILFPQAIPPVLTVPARQYPVTSHFAKRTEIKHYLRETYRKVIQIHNKLPPGGILVFLTGKQEILSMCRKLYHRFYGKKKKGGKNNKRKRAASESDPTAIAEEGEEELVMSELQADAHQQEKDRESAPENLEEMMGAELMNDHEEGNDELDAEEEEEIDLELAGSDDENDNDDISISDPLHPNYQSEKTAEGESTKMTVEETTPTDSNAIRQSMLAKLLGTDFNPAVSTSSLPPQSSNDPTNTTRPEEPAALPALKPLIYPLYAMMSPKLQERVFRAVPEGYRLIVIATNVAETSITIPNISYVVDTGRCKEKKTVSAGGNSAGITKYEINWISKASADQRQGRAGRTGPGHCYRLYSANFYHQYMKPYAPPEITITPLEDVVLQMAALGIRDLYSFPFPTNPPKRLIQNAIQLLHNLGACLPLSALPHMMRQQLIPKHLQFMYQSKESIPMEEDQESGNIGQLTTIGKFMSFFPIHPRFSKIVMTAVMSLLVHQVSSLPAGVNLTDSNEIITSFQQSMGYILTLVASMAEKSIFIQPEFDNDQSSQKKQSSKADKNSDDETDESGDDDNSVGEESNPDWDEDENPLKKDGNTNSSGAHSHKLDRLQAEKGLFHHPHGDSLALLRGTGAYAYMIAQQFQKQVANSNDVSQQDLFSKRNLHRLLHQTSTNNLSQVLESFCQSHQLHQMTLHRILDLRYQLQQILQQLLPKFSTSLLSEEMKTKLSFTDLNTIFTTLRFPLPVSPPSATEESMIRQVLFSGYTDQIARKIPLGLMKIGTKRERMTGYTACYPMVLTRQMQEKLDEHAATEGIAHAKTADPIVPLYFHPHSNLYPSNVYQRLPQYVIYHSIVLNQAQTKYYMTNVTVIEESWITEIAKDSPLLSYGEILTTPSPYYNSEEDTIYCYCKPRYGHANLGQAWELATVCQPMEEILEKKHGSWIFSPEIPAATTEIGVIGYRKEDEIYRWFAKFLLEGNIFPFMKIIAEKEHWKEMIHQSLQQNKLHPKISKILMKLAMHKIYTKGSFLRHLRKNDQNFLLKELCDLVKQSNHQVEIKQNWKKLANV